jgi:predicted aspartyl protease
MGPRFLCSLHGDMTMVDTRKSLFALLCLLVLFAMFPRESHPKFYKYVDRDGRVFFVDDPSKIPPEYSEDLKAYQEKYDHLSPEERSIMLEKERKETEKNRSEQRAKEASLRSRRTKVIIEGNQVLVPVTLGYEDNKTNALLLLDTGASIMVLHQNVADKLKIKKFQQGTARLPGGGEIKTKVAELDYVKVGPHKKDNLRTGIIEHKGPSVRYMGLLGMNFLKDLEYNVDFNRQVIEWNP